MAQKINVDVTPGLFQQTLYYHQGDVGREFEIEIATKDGYTIPSGATFTIQATKPSGFGFTVTGTATGNVVAFTSTEEMTDEFGRFPAQLKIADGTDTIFTANFLMVGEIDVHPDGTTDGSQETIIPTLTLLVERVENAAAAVLDTTTEVTTLPAGSQATYSFDEETNTATFGIPQGEAGAGSAGVVASAYSASKTYAVGDYAIHNSNLYRCTTAITTAESFTASHWTQVVLADDVTDLKSDLTNHQNELLIVGEDFRTDNLYNKYTMRSLKWLNRDGTLIDDSGYNVSDYIDVSAYSGQRLYFGRDGGYGSSYQARRINTYDETKAVVRVIEPPNGSYVDIASGEKYVRLCFANTAQNVMFTRDVDNISTYKDYWESKLPTLNGKIVQSAGNYLFEVTDFVVEKPLGEPFAYVKFDQLTMIRRYASTIAFSYSDITANLWTVQSYKGTKDCLFVSATENGVGQALVFDTSSMSVKYRAVSAIKNTDIVLVAVKDSPSGSEAKVVGELISYHAFHQQNRYDINDRRFIALPIQASVMNKQTDAINVGDYTSFVFAYVGDPHAYPSRKAYANTSLLSAGKTAENMNLDAVYIAGDLIASSNTLTRKEAENALLICNDDVKSQDRRIVIKGNHDANGHTEENVQQYSWTVPNDAFYRCCLANLEKNPNVVWGSRVDAYYYVDYPERKVRVICLNTSDTGSEITNDGNLKYDSLIVCGLRQAQVSWLVNTAMDMSGKSDWHVAVFMHIAVNSGVTDNYPSVQNASAIDGIFKAFKNGSNYHASYTDNVNADGLFTIDAQANFATQGATPFIGVFAGHVHNDQLVTDGYTTVTATESLSRGKTNRDNYTYNEIAYDVVNVDRSNRKVYLKRIGYGSDREFSY